VGEDVVDRLLVVEVEHLHLEERHLDVVLGKGDLPAVVVVVAYKYTLKSNNNTFRAFRLRHFFFKF